MKKLVMMLVCMFAVHTMVMADNDKPIEVSQLPAKAQTFIKTYFKDHKVAMAKLESGMFYKSYDVVFTNGEKVEFDKSGEWKEVRCRQSEVPAAQAFTLDKEDGEYSIQVELEGGSGKASVTSPTLITVKNGEVTADIQWSSSNYDYMIVDGKKYLPVNEEGTNSEFQIPVTIMDESMPVIADTTAMGTPHEINYTLTFYSDSIGSKSQMPQEAAKRVVAVALVIIIGGGILNYFVNKRNRC